MLTPEQVQAYRDLAGQLFDPLTDWLIADIARRVAEAGEFTATAAYQVWRTRMLGKSSRQIRDKVAQQLGISKAEAEALLTQSAESSYNYDISHMLPGAALPLEGNTRLQQLIKATVDACLGELDNLTQTLGMVDPYGNAMPLQDVYRQCSDFAYRLVSTGAADHNTATRRATEKLAAYGLRTIDYESGVHTSMEAAVRRNVMGSMGLLQEQLSQQAHDSFGANGWEISAHEGSAPDHEPIQGRQYSDADYKALNDSLVRRIGTLNCGHSASPIILGVSQPVYSEAELAAMQQRNADGITYRGRKYTLYGATQQQRKLERSIRTQKRRILADEASGNKDKLTTDQIRLQELRREYEDFSAAAKLPTQYERANVVGFGNDKAREAAKAAKDYHKYWIKSIGAQSSELNTLAKFEDAKYNNSPAYQMLMRYAGSVARGMISPLAGFDNYASGYSRIQTELVGKTAANKVIISGQSDHFMERVLGTIKDPNERYRTEKWKVRSGIEIDKLIECVLHGEVRPVKWTKGKPSQLLRTDSCEVSINPETGQLIQCNPK